MRVMLHPLFQQSHVMILNPVTCEEQRDLEQRLQNANNLFASEFAHFQCT